ncbi:MAG: anthranilate synthase component I [Candidatus Nanopelagicales bacterium]
MSERVAWGFVLPAPGGSAPGLDRFRELAPGRRVIPVVRRLLADGETPVGLYRKLAGERPGTFLLESAEHGRSYSRYSFVGVRSSAMLTESDGAATWVGRPPIDMPSGGDPLETLREVIGILQTDRPTGLPPLTGGMVGYLGYDAVRRWERVPDANPDELGLPELGFLLATDIAVLDHADGTVLLIANAINYDATDERIDDAWHDAMARLDRMEADLSAPAQSTVSTYDPAAEATPARRTTAEAFQASVEAAKEYIRAGDAFQVVLSQRFDVDCPASALDVYRVLRVTNPSPYMYLLRIPQTDGDGVAFDIVGSSPEALVTVHEGRCLLHPIAGTRRRGSSPEEDARLGEDLLSDEKERAEHLMLVDLGRNDLGRVCDPGSVEVVDFMQVERYSHVIHLVSTVVGALTPDRGAYDALAATFPAGTLSGAPKPRAMQIIDELEPARRSLYGGCVGYIDFAGDLDMAIAIRTAVIRPGVAHVQAGAGVVADSVPAAEDAECQAKAMAVLRAVAIAGTLRTVATEPVDA